MTDSARLFSLDGRVALVTGAGAGIGRASATALAGAGALVITSDRDGPAAAEAARGLEEAGHAAEPATLEVTDEAAVERVIDEAAARHGRLDILVNNAGHGARKPSLELTTAEWDAVIAVNQTATFVCSRAAARHMIAQGGGAIVSIASIMGIVGRSFFPNIAYHASKAAVVNMTRALAAEWGPSGIRVNAVAPGYTRTRMAEQLFGNSAIAASIVRETPLGRSTTTEDVAAVVLFLASPAAAMVTGHTVPVDGGWLACGPTQFHEAAG